MLKSELEAEVKRLKDKLEDYWVQYTEEQQGRSMALNQIECLKLDIEQLDGDIDTYDTALNRSTATAKSLIEKNNDLIDDRQRLINKNEAMQSVMDSMAHLATAGQALIEL